MITIYNKGIITINSHLWRCGLFTLRYLILTKILIQTVLCQEPTFTISKNLILTQVRDNQEN